MGFCPKITGTLMSTTNQPYDIMRGWGHHQFPRHLVSKFKSLDQAVTLKLIKRTLLGDGNNFCHPYNDIFDLPLYHQSGGVPVFMRTGEVVADGW